MKKTLALSALIMQLFAIGAARGDLDGELKEIFQGTMSTNVTNGGIYRGGKMDTLSAGSFNLRYKSSRPDIISFKPPSFKKGCGSMSMYGGAFSFISKDELVAFLKTLPDAATAYAFGMAINGMCPSCHEQMQELQRKIQALNAKMKNSCELVESTLKEPMEYLVKQEKEVLAPVDRIVQVQGSDWLSSIPPKDIKTGDLSATARKDGSINVTWEALKLYKPTTWSTLSETMKAENMQWLMSFIGTRIVNARDIAPGADNSKYDAFPRADKLGLRGLVSGGKFDYWECDAEPPPLSSKQCLAPTLTADKELQGMYVHVAKILFGTAWITSQDAIDVNNIGDGLLSKLRGRSSIGTPSLTQDELNFQALSRKTSLFFLTKKLRSDQEVAFHGEGLARMVATEIAADYINNVLTQVQAAYRKVKHSWAAEYVVELENMKTSIATEKAVMMREYQDEMYWVNSVMSMRAKVRGG